MNSQLSAGKSVMRIDIIKVNEKINISSEDDVSIEEPLEIKVLYTDGELKVTKNISVTMRTPGNDAELASGFLFTEGIITSKNQIKSIERPMSNCKTYGENSIIVELEDYFRPNLRNIDRNFYTTSSCGVCGKGSIESIRTVSTYIHQNRERDNIELSILYQLSEKLRAFQNNFSVTGGIHGSGLFDMDGNLIAIREDVGRHNALDKLIGYAVSSDLLPLDHHILLLSGRASFELIQKAAMAGITTVAAIGAPSSLAVDLAKEFDMTLIGFLRDNRFNIYHLGSHFTIENL